MLLFRIDTEGYFIEDYFLTKDVDLPDDVVWIKIPQGLHKPRLVDRLWVEGKTADEFAEDAFYEALQPSHLQIEKATRELETIELLIEMGVIRS